MLLQVGPFIDAVHSMFKDGLVKYEGMMVDFEEIFLLKGRTTRSDVLLAVFVN
jgi:hypothetical protein